jgi:hypothetical protein
MKRLVLCLSLLAAPAMAQQPPAAQSRPDPAAQALGSELMEAIQAKIQLRAQNILSTAELDATKAELAKAKAELSAAKAETESARAELAKAKADPPK